MASHPGSNGGSTCLIITTPQNDQSQYEGKHWRKLALKKLIDQRELVYRGIGKLWISV